MFKDMKVSLKILLGFGIVLGLMVLLAVVLTASSISSVNSISDCYDMSEIQITGNELLDKFYDAMIGASVIYTVPNDDEYQRILDDYADIETLLNSLSIMTRESEILNKYESEVTALMVSTDNWLENIKMVQSANTEMSAVKASLKEAGGYIAQHATSIYSEQQALMIASGSPPGALEALALAERLEINIYETRRNAVAFLESGNLGLVANYHQTVADTKDLFTAYIGNITSHSIREQMDTLFSMYTSYTDGASLFIERCQEKEAYANTAKNVGTQTTSVIYNLVQKFDDDRSVVFSDMEKSAVRSLVIVIVLSVISVVLGIFMAGTIRRSITRPLSKMYRIIDAVATTGRMKFSDAEVQEIKSAVSNDEIGETIAGFSNMLSRLVTVSDELENLAQGDLTIDLKALSAEDTIANALNDTVGSLNEMFGSINESTAHVSAGAEQIADGAQVLAKGSTEQAATIEELSASVSEIAEKTKTNAEMAGQAADLANTIIGNAEKGSRQMQDMINAVREINESSHNISKVIKVIDDIAFQTNILALNAAVEAARAGQHGKGFAVVAEEVRALAAKSAEAAKNTGGLIANSVEKAELGAKLADDTAASFVDIVSGINESSRLVSEIARSSAEQSGGITQINAGIEQVAQVVQQNSATAQQSAAASQEMSSQAAILDRLIMQFKLKDNSRNTLRQPAPKRIPEMPRHDSDLGKY